MVRRSRPGFTMVEVLVAVSLSMLMVSVAWTLFSQTQRVAKRTQARLQLHASAKTIYESLRRDLLAMQQSCAFWLVSQATPTSIDLVFMTAAMDEAGYQMKGGWSNVAVGDLAWVRWHWNGTRHRLESARNMTSRTWPIDQAADGIPANPAAPAEVLANDIPSARFWPQPRRYTAGDVLQGAAGLDGNRWQLSTAGGAAVGAGRNLGDWTDLQQRLGPVCSGVQSCTIELVQAGKTAGGAVRTVHADGSADLNFCAHGIRMDGVASRFVTDAPAAITGFPDEIGERPAVLRISFVLVDAPTGISLPFSFSIALPGPALLP
jgi:Tfp pilus assembly protein PilE